MYNGIGLQTVRGTATNGYVVRNMSYVKPIMVRAKTGRSDEDWGSAAPKQRRACDEILEHEKKREVEVKVLDLQESMEEKGCVFPVQFIIPLYMGGLLLRCCVQQCWVTVVWGKAVARQRFNIPAVVRAALSAGLVVECSPALLFLPRACTPPPPPGSRRRRSKRRCRPCGTRCLGPAPRSCPLLPLPLQR